VLTRGSAGSTAAVHARDDPDEPEEGDPREGNDLETQPDHRAAIDRRPERLETVFGQGETLPPWEVALPGYWRAIAARISLSLSMMSSPDTSTVTECNVPVNR
jgi:hypothetical protein